MGEAMPRPDGRLCVRHAQRHWGGNSAVTVLNRTSRSREIHDSLGHPVVDADGHWLEPIPIFLEFLRDVGGVRSVEAFERYRRSRWDSWYASSPDELRSKRMLRASWWTWPSETLDRATVMIPELLYARLDEFGLDYSIIYPTLGLGIQTIADPDLRAAVVRALNMMSAELFAPFSDRLTPVATLSAYSPAEAVEELRYCVRELGLKTAWLHGAIRRPVPAFEGSDGSAAQFIDNLVLDNAESYDPLWREFVDLGVPVSTHAGAMGWADRTSPTNYCYNHVGHFAQANHVFCRALFLAGVTYRFPTLNFAFLEGGCGWAVNLYHDLVGHWEKRSGSPIRTNLDPRNLDLERLAELFRTYGGRWFADRADEMLDNLDPYYPGFGVNRLAAQEEGHELDDFAAAHVDNKEEFRTRFAQNFYFGCEADDPLTLWATDERMGVALKPIFSSDIGHFDVIRANEVLEEAYELVEDGHLEVDAFRSFTLDNALELYTEMNPRFFEGTVVEEAARTSIERRAAR